MSLVFLSYVLLGKDFRKTDLRISYRMFRPMLRARRRQCAAQTAEFMHS